MEKEIKEHNSIAHWFADNYADYKQNKLSESRTKKWKEFIEDDKYNKYFMSLDELWFINFEKLKKFVEEHKKRPSRKGLINGIINEDVKKLGAWLHSQLWQYKDKRGNIYNNEDIRKTWEEFLQDDFYGKYIKSD